MKEFLELEKNTVSLLIAGGELIGDNKKHSKLLSVDPMIFTQPVHRNLFKIVQELLKSKLPINYANLNQFLKLNSKINIDDYMAFVMHVKIPEISVHIQDLDILKENYERKKIQTSVNEINRQLPTASLLIIKELAGKLRDNVNIIGDDANINTGGSLIKEFRDKIFNGEVDKPLQLGISAIDNILHGVSRRDLLIIGGRPGEGKTALAINIAENISINGKVIFFSLESKVQELMSRLIAQKTGLNTYDIINYDIDNKIIDSHKANLDGLINDNLILIDKVEFFEDFMNSLSNYALTLNPIAIIIDYIQILECNPKVNKFYQKHTELTFIAKTLAEFVKNYQIPVIALAALKRPEYRTKKVIPELSDLKESGSLEQYATKVVLLYDDKKEFKHAVETSQLSNTLDKGFDTNTYSIDPGDTIIGFNVAKNRYGPTGLTSALFKKKHQSFKYYSKKYNTETQSKPKNVDKQQELYDKDKSA